MLNDQKESLDRGNVSVTVAELDEQREVGLSAPRSPEEKQWEPRGVGPLTLVAGVPPAGAGISEKAQ